MKRKQSLLLIWVSILIVSMACSLVGGAGEESQAPVVEQPEQEDVDVEGAAETEQGETQAADTEEESMSEESQEYDTEFPLPDDVQNFTGGGEQVNFATNMSIEQSIDFYRRIFAEMGLKERNINTAITETTFSMVFDGHTKGEAIVVQGVDLGNGTTNINIRFEDV